MTELRALPDRRAPAVVHPPDGARSATYRRQLLLGHARLTSHGWKFLPAVAGHKPSRKWHPTLKRCLPRWVGYPDRCESEYVDAGQGRAAIAIVELGRTMIRKTMRICGVRTSVKLELAFWTYLQAVAEQRGILLTQLVDEVAMGAGRNLASTLRVFCLNTAHARIADLEAALRATSRR